MSNDQISNSQVVAFIDITRTLNPSIATWPGDTPFNLEPSLEIIAGESVNLTTITMSAHTGTHIDAPHHFCQEGNTVASLNLLPYWGLAQVVSVAKSEGPLVPMDFSHVDLSLAPRLLVHSHSSERDPTIFDDQIVYPSPELADALGAAGILLYGSDGPSMDAVDDAFLPGHKALYRNNIMILEGLDLCNVEDGLYELVAFPLKLAGGDGSPVRAVLRTISNEK